MLDGNKPEPHGYGINAGDPVAGTVAGLWPMWRGAGPVVQELVNGTNDTLSGATWVPSDHGPAINLSGVNQRVNLPTFTIDTAKPFTLSFLVRPTSIDASDNTLIAADANTTDFLFDFNDADSIRMRTVGAPTNSEWSITPADFLDRFRMITLTYRLTPNILYELFFDGVSQGTRAPGSAATASYTGFRFGVRANNDADFVGQFSQVVIHERVLGNGEVEDLSANPFRLITPGTQTIPVEVAAGGGVKLIGRGGPMIGAGGGLIA